MKRHTRAPGARGAAGAAALLLLALCAPSAGGEEPPDGVALVDSCGTYVRMREGSEGYQPSQIERTRLCSDLLWAAAGELKGQVLGEGERRAPGRGDPVRCALDPQPMGPHQSVRIAYRYLSDHPERLHFPAGQLAREALRDAFGCAPVDAS